MQHPDLAPGAAPADEPLINSVYACEIDGDRPVVFREEPISRLGFYLAGRQECDSASGLSVAVIIHGPESCIP